MYTWVVGHAPHATCIVTPCVGCSLVPARLMLGCLLLAHNIRQRTCTAFDVHDRCACVKALASSLRTVLRHTFRWSTTC